MPMNSRAPRNPQTAKLEGHEGHERACGDPHYGQIHWIASLVGRTSAGAAGFAGPGT